MALNSLLQGAGKILEADIPVTRVKSPVDSFSLALDQLIFGGGPTTPNATSTSIGGSGSLKKHLVSPFATKPRRQQTEDEDCENDEDEDVQSDDEHDKQGVDEPTQNEERYAEKHLLPRNREDFDAPGYQRANSAYGTEFSGIAFAYGDAEQDENDSVYARYDPCQPEMAAQRSSQGKHSQNLAAIATAPAQDLCKDGLEDYESDAEEASGNADVVLGSIHLPENFNNISTTRTVTEEHRREDKAPRMADVAQAFLDGLFSDNLNAASSFTEIHHSAALSDIHLSNDYSEPTGWPNNSRANTSFPRSVYPPTSFASSIPSARGVIGADTVCDITTPRLTTKSRTPQASVDRTKRAIRLHHGKAPYQSHRPSYMPHPFVPPYIPTSVIGSPHGNIPQVEWDTPTPIPNAEALSGTDDALRDVEMTTLDQLVERYYWDERAVAVWAEDDTQREAIQQHTPSVKAMKILNEFAAAHPQNFIARRLQELDDVLTPPSFQSTTYHSRFTSYPAQAGSPTLEEEGGYHQLIQRYRDIYKGYRLFAYRHRLPLPSTVLDFDADVTMLGPHE